METHRTFWTMLLVLQLVAGGRAALFKFDQQTGCSDKVQLELYYETLCPYCHNYLQRSLQPLLKTPGIDGILSVKLIPYGNAKTIVGEDGTTTFKCQHGQ